MIQIISIQGASWREYSQYNGHMMFEHDLEEFRKGLENKYGEQIFIKYKHL